MECYQNKPMKCLISEYFCTPPHHYSGGGDGKPFGGMVLPVGKKNSRTLCHGNDGKQQNSVDFNKTHDFPLAVSRDMESLS